MGYYKIAPRTILASLDGEDTNIFTTLPEVDALALEALTGLSIYWKQADFLRIASAMGQFSWGDPMDLRDWNVSDIFFGGSCGESIGFDYADITYFRTRMNSYTTRFIDIDPYFGLVRWGKDEIYLQPIMQKWKSVDLLGSEINADDALRIVNEDVKVHFQLKDNICGVMMSSSRYDPENWDSLILRGPLDPIDYTVNLYTGEFKIENK